MNKEINNKLQRGLALTVKESWELYKYIKALEQTELNPSYNSVKTELDCISRDDAIELIAGADETDGNEPVFSGKQVIKMLKGLPPVTPKSGSGEVSMLDKIRAEIEAKIVRNPWFAFEDKERDRNDAFLEVLDIIDKYKEKVRNKE